MRKNSSKDYRDFSFSYNPNDNEHIRPHSMSLYKMPYNINRKRIHIRNYSFSKWNTFVINQFKIEISNAPTKAAPKVCTVKPLITPEPKNQKIAPFITREKRPRVMILSGRVKILRIGLINIFTSVRHAPTIRTTQSGLMFISLIIFVVAQTAIDNATQCKINFIPYEAGNVYISIAYLN